MVSIIMPVYNVGRYIEKCVNSVINQTYTDLEIILVDDGSTDDSGVKCDYFASKDKRVRVIHQKNAGSGYARNAGLDIAIGEYIYFVDPDDYIEPTLIEENIKIAVETSSDVVIFGHYNEIDDADEKVKRVDTYTPPFEKSCSYEEFISLFPKFFEGYPYVLWNRLFKTDYIKRSKCRFTNQNTGQDALFILDLYRVPFSCTFNPKPYYYYITRTNSAINKFRTDRYKNSYNLCISFDGLLEKWDKKDDSEFKILLEYSYARVAVSEINNMDSSECKLKHSEKRKRIALVMKLPSVREAVKNIPYDIFPYFSMKGIVFFLKKKMYGTAIAFRRMYTVLSSIRYREMK